jgi:hypothetical protein
MKRQVGYLLAGAFLFTSSLMAKGLVEMDSPVDQIYTPRGLTTSDNAEVILQGYYRSSCYQPGTTAFDVQPDAGLITVEATSLFDPDKVCLQVMTPFLQTVKLGAIPAGDYEVALAGQPEIWTTLNVELRDQESPDELLAPVGEAKIMTDQNSGKQFLRLSGEYPHFFIGCMVIREVDISQPQADMLQVKPVAELIPDGPICDEQAMDPRFVIEQGLSQPFAGPGLLHVRGFQGQTLNTFVGGF